MIWQTAYAKGTEQRRFVERWMHRLVLLSGVVCMDEAGHRRQRAGARRLSRSQRRQ